MDGSILSSRYKSSKPINYVDSLYLYGDYVISIIGFSPTYLVMHNIATFDFTIKKSSDSDFNSILSDSSNGR